MVPISIGQGYNALTRRCKWRMPAILANNGVVFRPHLSEEVLDHESQQITVYRAETRSAGCLFAAKHFHLYQKRDAARAAPGGTAACRLGFEIQHGRENGHSAGGADCTRQKL